MGRCKHSETVFYSFRQAFLEKSACTFVTISVDRTIRLQPNIELTWATCLDVAVKFHPARTSSPIGCTAGQVRWGEVVVCQLDQQRNTARCWAWMSRELARLNRVSVCAAQGNRRDSRGDGSSNRSQTKGTVAWRNQSRKVCLGSSTTCVFHHDSNTKPQQTIHRYAHCLRSFSSDLWKSQGQSSVAGDLNPWKATPLHTVAETCFYIAWMQTLIQT